MEEEFKIVQFEEKYFQQLKQLIRDGWNQNHILQKSDELLRWQYTGYGQMGGMKLPLLFHGDKMIGFRLMIPIELMLSDKEGNHKVIPSAVSTLYFVDANYRGMKLGLKLQLYTIEHYGGYFSIASNLKTSAPIYKKSGAKMLETMYRYFRPLSQDISALIVGECEKDWDYMDSKMVMVPHEITAKELAEAWQKTVEGKNITSLNKSESFFQWRYLDSPIYKYYCFGREADGGYVVARVCDLFDGNKQKTGKKVFRILELIPGNRDVWDGKADNKLAALIDGACGWAKEQGCMAAEFYMSSSRFGKVMEEAGFEEINKDELLASSVMSYFEPCDMGHRLSNVFVQSSLVAEDFDFENSYFTLSDADQDRPNII